jgi:hypothetical protein
LPFSRWMGKYNGNIQDVKPEPDTESKRING